MLTLVDAGRKDEPKPSPLKTEVKLQEGHPLRKGRDFGLVPFAVSGFVLDFKEERNSAMPSPLFYLSHSWLLVHAFFLGIRPDVGRCF